MVTYNGIGEYKLATCRYSCTVLNSMTSEDTAYVACTVCKEDTIPRIENPYVCARCMDYALDTDAKAFNDRVLSRVAE